MGKINKKINTILYNMPLNEWVMRKQDFRNRAYAEKEKERLLKAGFDCAITQV